MSWETGWCDQCGTPIGAGHCGGCVAVSCVDAEEPHDDCACPYCGKDLEDFSDLGCEYCDARHPGFTGRCDP